MEVKLQPWVAIILVLGGLALALLALSLARFIDRAESLTLGDSITMMAPAPSAAPGQTPRGASGPRRRAR